MPVKPLFVGAQIYHGKFNEDILDFLPVRGHWRKLIANRDPVICKNHPAAQGEKIICPGDDVVAMKWLHGKRGPLPEFRVFFYCSEACQSSHVIPGNFKNVIK